MKQSISATESPGRFSREELDSVKRLMDVMCSSLPADKKKKLLAEGAKEHCSLVLGGLA
ncbi:MAG: hypothetical protein ABII79_00885 [bacterium]